MTELSFLIDLLLNHELPKPTKDLIASRIKEVEEGLTFAKQIFIQESSGVSPKFSNAMQKHMEGHNGNIPNMSQLPRQEMPSIIAHTPATQAAVTARAAIIDGQRPAQVSTGKDTKGPRKW